MTVSNLENLLKDKDYFGFKFHSCYKVLEYDTVQITFINEDKHFRIQLVQYLINNSTPKQLLEYIDNLVLNSSDLKKLAHQQQFNNVMDEILKVDE